MDLEIIFQSEEIIAINKPHGLLVHKTNLARDAKVFALQELRNQIGQHVFPVHRLDRKTSGVLVFALNREMQSKLSQMFRERKINKLYHAIVRGYVEKEGTIDYDLTNERGVTQSAITHYKLLEHFEINVPFGKHQTSRYSLVELCPETGRMHQLRKHMAHIFHPIIGDRPHGCNKQNRLWKEKWQETNMMLHAQCLCFKLNANLEISINAEYSESMKNVLRILAS